MPTLPPAIQGLGQFGGFQFVVQDQAAHKLEELAGATQGLMQQAGAAQGSGRLFTPFTANDPQYLVTIDREKAKSLHVPLSQITDTLGVYMGSAYVNDFDFNNRSYRVYVQADKQFRATAQDMKQFYVRSDSGAMVPLDNLISIDADDDAAGDQPLQPVPVGGNRWLAGAGIQLGAGDRGDGRAGEEDAAGILLQLDGTVAGGIGRQAGRR